MPLEVSDSTSNSHDQVAHAAEVIGKSRHRAKVFEVICFGKKKIKTVTDIRSKSGLPHKRIREEARKLVNKHVIEQKTIRGQIVYLKNSFLAAHLKKILSLARDRKKQASFPTKIRPHPLGGVIVKIRISKKQVCPKQITIDDIDSFSEVRNLSLRNKVRVSGMSELTFKNGIRKILGEEGTQKDWGGEGNDLFTTRLKINKKRVVAAFAFKGKATKGKLTPAKMGKNGDQIVRLFASSATIFVVQCFGEIAESITEMMRAHAVAKSIATEKGMYFCLIDGQDSNRLIQAYPSAF